MIKFILGVLGFGPSPWEMPEDIWLAMKAEHPELKTRDQWADYLVDNCDSSYGEAYSALPERRFK